MKSPGRPKTRTADYQRLTIRLPDDIMATVRDKAARAARPLNAQIERIVTKWVKDELAHPTPDV